MRARATWCAMLELLPTVSAVLGLLGCDPKVPPGGPAPSRPGTRILDDVELKPEAGLPVHAVRRFGTPRVAVDDKEPTLHWLDDRRLLVIDHGIWAPRDVARIWDVTTGKVLWVQPIEKHGGPMADHRTWVLDRGHDRLSLVWRDMRVVDLQTQKVIWRLPQAKRDPPYYAPSPPVRVLLCSDGRVAAAPLGSNHIGVWSLDTGKQIADLLFGLSPGGSNRKTALMAISPGGRYLVVKQRWEVNRGRTGDNVSVRVEEHYKVVQVHNGKEITLPVKPTDLAGDNPLHFDGSDEKLRISTRQGTVLLYNPILGSPYVETINPGERAPPGQLLRVEVQKTDERCIVRSLPSGKILMDYRTGGDPDSLCLDEQAVSWLQLHGRLRVVDRARLRLPLEVPLLPGETVVWQEVAEPLVFVRTNQRVLMVDRDERLTPVAGALLHTLRGDELQRTHMRYDSRHHVLSSVDLSGEGPRLQLWRIPSGEQLHPPRSKVNLFSWLASRHLHWERENLADTKEARRKWFWGDSGVPAPDERVGAVLYEDPFTRRDWLVLRRTRDGAMLWRYDYRRKTEDGWETPGPKTLTWSSRGDWLASHFDHEEGTSIGPELRVFDRMTGRSKVLWRGGINCGPVFSLRNDDLLVGSGGVAEGSHEIRCFDPKTGMQRWATTLPGRCMNIATDSKGRVLALVEHPALHYSVVEVQSKKTLITLPHGLDIDGEFSPHGRYLHTRLLDTTEYLWRIPGMVPAHAAN